MKKKLNMTLLAKIAVVFVFASIHQSESNKVSTSSQPSEQTGRPLPRSDLSWETIRAENYLYIDKTPYLIKLLETSRKLTILTRPRRFGKSVFLQMMADFFRGEKGKFEGLAIYDEGNTKYFAKLIPKTEVTRSVTKWTEFPVIYLNFGDMGDFDTKAKLKSKLLKRLKKIAFSYQLDPSTCRFFNLADLIEDLNQKFNLPVIILVDEYDHPLQYALLQLKNKKLAQDVKGFLHSIFTVIKSKCKSVGLAFVTGASKVSLSSIESAGINAFTDLTFDKDFAGAFGFSKSEIKDNLTPHMIKFAQNIPTTQNGKKAYNSTSSKDYIFEKLKFWYDGYQFAEKSDACKVLNPVSTLESLMNQEFGSYWTSTGSMEYLVHRFYKENYSLDRLKKGISIFRQDLQVKHDVLKTEPPLHIWMLLLGYYTISTYDKESDKVMLKFPNTEIEEAIETNLAMYIPSQKKYINQDFPYELNILRNAMETQNTQGAMKILSSFAFQSYKNPLNLTANPHEVVKRLEVVFRAARINHQLSSKFKKDGEPKLDGKDVDIQTTNLNINYIIEVKSSTSKDDTALSTIKNQLRYIRDHPNPFRKAIRNQDKYYLLALNFLFQEGSAQLNSWIAVPCVNGTLQYSGVKAEPEYLIKQFSE